MGLCYSKRYKGDIMIDGVGQEADIHQSPEVKSTLPIELMTETEVKTSCFKPENNFFKLHQLASALEVKLLEDLRFLRSLESLETKLKRPICILKVLLAMLG